MSIETNDTNVNAKPTTSKSSKSKAAVKPPLEASSEGGSGELKLPSIDFRILCLRVGGLSPLIVHAWSEKAKGMMREKQQKQGRVAKAAKDPQADFIASKYLNKAGEDCVPAAGFRNAMISAGRYTEGVPMTIIRGSVFVLADPEGLVKLENYKCNMREDMVRVGGKGPGTGVADLRYRAEYSPWEVMLNIQYNANSLSAEQVITLVRFAGMSVGLCEWRPEKNGQFGRFDITGKINEVRGAAAAAIIEASRPKLEG